MDEDLDILVWKNNSYTGKFNEIMESAKTDNISVYKNTLLFWTFPISVFKAFEEVYILTYMFDSQIQNYYFMMNNVEVEHIGTLCVDDKYLFADTPMVPEYAKLLKDRVHILDDEKLNRIGDDKYALSVSWFKRDTPDSKDLTKKLKNNLRNLFVLKYKSTAAANMWTTFKEYRKNVTGAGYSTGFIPFNSRATNEYRHKTHLAYCCNVFMNPFMKNYFTHKGIDVKEDEYALSMLVQWLFRSAIRDNQDVYLYIPSSRMRGLLVNWLNSFDNNVKEVNTDEIS